MLSTVQQMLETIKMAAIVVDPAVLVEILQAVVLVEARTTAADLEVTMAEILQTVARVAIMAVQADLMEIMEALDTATVDLMVITIQDRLSLMLQILLSRVRQTCTTLRSVPSLGLILIRQDLTFFQNRIT